MPPGTDKIRKAKQGPTLIGRSDDRLKLWSTPMRMQVDDEGNGEPVLLAHAGVSDRRVWDATAPALVAAGYRTIRYDRPGYGRSPRPSGPHSPVADALAVLDDVGVESAHWVGLSIGADIGVQVALAQPARIRSLALIAPGMFGYEWPAM